jgi:hypothetical protein
MLLYKAKQKKFRKPSIKNLCMSLKIVEVVEIEKVVG